MSSELQEAVEVFLERFWPWIDAFLAVGCWAVLAAGLLLVSALHQ